MTNVAHLCQCVIKSTCGRSQWPDRVPAIPGTSSILLLSASPSAPLPVSHVFRSIFKRLFFVFSRKKDCLRMVTK